MDNGQWEMLKVGSVEKCTKNVEKCIFIGFFLQFIWSCQLFFVTLQRIIVGTKNKDRSRCSLKEQKHTPSPQAVPSPTLGEELDGPKVGQMGRIGKGGTGVVHTPPPQAVPLPYLRGGVGWAKWG